MAVTHNAAGASHDEPTELCMLYMPVYVGMPVYVEFEGIAAMRCWTRQVVIQDEVESRRYGIVVTHDVTIPPGG